MAHRSATKSEVERFDKMRDLGCIVCLNEKGIYTPPAIHHIDGQTKEGCHLLTIPLCQWHHQYKTAGEVSRHGDGRKAFEKAYGTEQELLEQVNNALGY